MSAQIPEDLSFSDYRGDSFTANWSGSLADGKLNVFMLTNKYVEGQTDFKAVNATSYTARWKYTPKAVGYQVTNYRIEEVTPGQAVTVIHETINKADQGTVDEPVSIEDPNEYADVQGWEGRNFIMADGMVGANKGAFPRNPSYLWSPKMNLSAADGKYTIHLKAHGTPGNSLSLYRIESDPTASLNIHAETFDANGVIDATWTMEDGIDDMQISFEESRLRPFLVDSFVVSQTFAAGSVISVPLSTAIIDSGSELSHTFTDLNNQSGYGYDVKAIREDESTSERSELQRVKLDVSAIEGVSAVKAVIR